MASITRKILGKDKDICFLVDGVLAAFIQPEGNVLHVPSKSESTKADIKAIDKVIAKAKRTDGIKSTNSSVGTIGIEDNEVVVRYA